jgi:two-component system phosphate regulon sensor histidine kinase PhoR
MFRSLRSRIATLCASLVLVALASASLLALGLAGRAHQDSLRHGRESQARLVANSLREPLQNGREATVIDAMVKALGRDVQARITAIATDGRVLGDSVEDPSRMDNHANRPEVMAALSSGYGESARHSATLGYDMVYVALPIQVGEVTLGVARVALPSAQVNQALSRLAVGLLAIDGLAMAVAVLLAWRLASLIAMPLAEFTQAARRVAEGDLQQPIQVRDTGEIGELAGAFNRMASRLSEAIDVHSQEHARLAAILANMADGIVVVGEQDQVITVNPAARRILGILEGAPLGKTFIEVVRDHELAQMVHDARGLPGASTRIVELGAPWRYVRATAKPLAGEQEGQIMLVVQDLSELRRLEMVRREFVANVSHELRTPLASLKALTETLQEGAIDDPQAAKMFLGRMQVEVEGLSQLVQELLELSRIESGRVALRRETTDVVQLVRQAAERLQPQASRQGIGLTVQAEPGLPELSIDGDRVQQVIINLVHNAIKFTPPGGRVTVATRASPEGVEVSVSDTGVGISPEDLPRIFERFYKGDRSRSGGGTGLGLAIAKHTIQAHGGRIWAESTPGRGSTFTFLLPVP